MTTSTRKKRSPLRGVPLRDPAQSLREEADDILTDEGFLLLMLAGFAAFYAICEWARWFSDMAPHPVPVTMISAGVIAWALLRLQRTKAKLVRLRKGIEGERHAAQFLQNELVPVGYRVMHDLCEDGYNIDHVLIGPTGAFALETKFFSKSEDGDGKITYDDTQLWIDGHTPERNPIAQAEGAAQRVQRILFQYSGVEIKVQPVVVVAGWRVERTGRKKGQTWVVNFAGLRSFLANESPQLEPAAVQRLFDALSQYQRQSEAAA